MTPATAVTEDDRRDALLLAILPHVAFEGWTETAIAIGCADAGLSRAEGTLVFPGGVGEILCHWAEWSDRRMRAALDASAGAGLAGGQRVAAAIRARIEANLSRREAVRRTLAYLALPAQIPLALRLAWRTADAISYAAGDTATDVRYYAKRALLAGIYTAALHYWLDDDSDGSAATWAFLERRLAAVLRPIPGSACRR